MQLIKNLSRSKVLRVLGIALMFAAAISFQKSVSADIGNGDRVLIVRAFNGNPIRDNRIPGVAFRINGGPDDGLTGVANSSGILTFHVHEGNFVVSASHQDFYTLDAPVFMDIGELTVDFPMVPKASTTPPPDPTPPPPGSECTPTPPRGRPMLNIWPISTSGAACTDYPLLSVKNVTQGTNWKNGTAINANAGDTLRVELYVHNGVIDYPENEAINAMVKANLSGNRISAEAWANNADRINSGQKGGDVTVNLGNATMSYVAGSAVLYDRNMAHQREFSDAVVTSGASMANMKGFCALLHLVPFDLRVNGPAVTPPPPPPAKATLTVVKKVVGGSLGVNDFELFVGDLRVTSGQANTFDPGVYFVRENNKPNYTAELTGECQSNGRINLASGDNKVCTITNTFQAPPQQVPPPVTFEKTIRNDKHAQTVFVKSASAHPGATVEFQLDLFVRQGNVYDMFIKDQLPSKLTYVDNSLVIISNVEGRITTLTPPQNNLSSIQIATLSINMERILTFKAVVKGESHFPVGSTTLTNTATLTHRDGSLSDTANVVVDKIAPQVGTISLTKNVRNVTQGQTVFSSSSTANPGDQVEFQMQVSASGGNVDNVIFSDQLPNRLIYVNNSLTVDGVASGNNLGVVILGNFTSGRTKKVIIRAKVAGTSEFPTGSTTLTNIANVTSNSNSASASANVVVNIGSVTPVVNLNITKLVRNVTQNQSGFVKSAAANPVDTIQFQIQTSVSGNTAAQNVVVRDSLPASVSLTSGSITNNLGTMNSGTTQTVNLTVTVASYNNFTCGSTTLTNSASASASNTNSVSDTASVIVTRNDNCGGGRSNPFFRLTTELRHSTTSPSFSNFTNAAFGERVEFRLTVRNNNFNSTAYNVRLSDALPNGLTYVPGTFQIDSGTSSGNLFGGSNQWLGNLSGNQSRIILFQASVNASTSQTLINSATATSDNTNSANAQATVFVSTVAGGNIDLVLSKSAYNQTRNVDATTVTAQPGDVILYTLRVQNPR